MYQIGHLADFMCMCFIPGQVPVHTNTGSIPSPYCTITGLGNMIDGVHVQCTCTCTVCSTHGHFIINDRSVKTVFHTL